MTSLDKHQLTALTAIQTYFKDNPKCLVQMFCGTGKTRLFLHIIFTYILNIVIFPSISLVTQFNKDYLTNPTWKLFLKDFSMLNICSRNELGKSVNYTTNKQTIINFLKTNLNKKQIITCTYTSLNLLISSIIKLKITIDLLVYDEAHHIVGNTVQQIVFDNELLARKTLFLTATPKNDNGVIMYDPNFKIKEKNKEEQIKEKPKLKIKQLVYNPDDDCADETLNNTCPSNYILNAYESDDDHILERVHIAPALHDIDQPKLIYDCGPRVVFYSHRQAVLDYVCKDFVISIVLSTKNTNSSIVESIAQSALRTGNKRILTFHGRSETQHDTVSDVVTFVSKPQLLIDAFHKHFDKKTKVTISGITGNTKDRVKILEAFDKTPDDEIALLASCRTIGEGIDLNNANAVCYADSKQSIYEITQNGGRVFRNSLREIDIPDASIILPCFVDTLKYSLCKTPEERDLVLKEDMGGNFENILNVLSALRESDPEHYDLCFRYPTTFTQSELITNFKFYNYKIIQMTSLSACIEYFTKKANTYMTITDVKEHIELHTNLIDDPILKYNYNKTSEPFKIYLNNETKQFSVLIGVEKIKAPSRRKLKIHTIASPEVKTLWKITDEIDLTKTILSVFIESTRVISLWDDVYDNLVKWVQKTNKIPVQHTDNLEEEILSQWCSRQRTLKRRNLLEERRIEKLNKINIWFWDLDYLFTEMSVQVTNWVLEHGKYPSPMAKTDLVERKYGEWCNTLRQKYKSGKLDVEQCKVLENMPNWWWCNNTKLTFEDSYSRVVNWIEKYNEYPSSSSNNPEEKKLAQWCKDQRKYKNHNTLNKEKTDALLKIPSWDWLIARPNVIKNIQTTQKTQDIDASVLCSTTTNRYAHLIKESTIKSTQEPILKSTQEPTINTESIIKLPKKQSTIVSYQKPTIITYQKPTIITYQKSTIITQPSLPNLSTSSQMQLKESRPYQQSLRQNALYTYENKCVITGEDYYLETAHIIPVSECTDLKSKGDINNTLLLQSLVHKFFDDFIISIDSNTSKVVIHESCRNKYLHAYNNKIIENLTDATKGYLKWHNTQYQLKHNI